MFRTEKRNQLETCCVGQNVDGAAPLRIETGVMGDQADMLAAKRREFFRFEYIEAGLHASHAARTFRGRKHGTWLNREQCDEDDEMNKTKMRPLESSQRVPRY